MIRVSIEMSEETYKRFRAAMGMKIATDAAYGPVDNVVRALIRAVDSQAVQTCLKGTCVVSPINT